MKFKGNLFILIAKNQGFTSVTEYVLSFCRKVEVITKIGGFRLIEAGEFYRAPPEVKEQEFLVDFSFKGKSYRFKSKKGVFADNKVDSGTKLLLDSADIREDDNVFDVGCGYGIIGIVAASLAPKGKTLLVDSNVKAANLAKLNIEVNNIKNANVATEDLVKTMIDGRFSLVLSNPPQHLGIKQVASLWSNVSNILENEAKGFIVIQKHLSRPYKRILSTVFPKVEEVITDGQYYIFKFHQ
jgi:16S rRNA (guanine1207-N2)-methyltransferase